METSNHLRDGHDRGYFTHAEIEPLLILARRASAALTRLLRSSNGSAERASRGTQTAKQGKRRTFEPKNPEPKTPEPKNHRTKEPKNQNPST
jgi:hypothetical protein